ncbi:MAG: polysaccharide deacetylase family protein [Myxococcota bacterium]|nr:polysaccharide deacetylase family protein [Deltaproteobacteria bacterium]MDQ3336679.1 polysaccharide deacetylase family protein [Myxococcota bacterium]
MAQLTPSYLFDEGVVDASPQDFAQQIRLLSTYFNPIGLDDLMTFLEGGRLPDNPVLVTFDDGYKDNHEVALPVLRRYGVKAVFFIATDYIERRRMFWWDRINCILKTARRSRIILAYPHPLILDVGSHVQCAHAVKLILRLVKSTKYLVLERFLTELAHAAGVDWSESQERDYANELLMTWEQIRDLRDAGMAIQSHTRTHRVLQTLSPEQLVEELEGSRSDLERELKERVYAISYPVGHAIDDRFDMRRALRAAGYTIGFTNATGVQHARSTADRYSVRRMGVDGNTPASLFRAMLAAPTVFG